MSAAASLPLTLILWILFIHWIADFVLQNESMAQGKSLSNYWLSIHVGVYTLVLLVATASINPFYALINGAIHWCVDYVTSRRTSFLWKQQRWHDFFVTVGADQLLHYITLFLTAYWLLT